MIFSTTMWFRIQFSNFTLAALVGRDCDDDVYWRVWDICLIIGKKTPSILIKFDSEGQVFRGKQIAPIPFSPKTGLTRVVKTHVLLDILRHETPLWANRFADMLNTGKATLYMSQSLAVFSNPCYSPVLFVDPDGDISISDWMKEFCKQRRIIHHERELAFHHLHVEEITSTENQIPSSEKEKELIATSGCGSSSHEDRDRTSLSSSPSTTPPSMIYQAKPVPVKINKQHASEKKFTHGIFGNVEPQDWFMNVDEEDSATDTTTLLPNKILISKGSSITIYVKQLTANGDVINK